MIESTFEVMHPSFEKTFAVQTAPELDRAERFLRGQLYPRKIDLGFIRRKIDIGENDNAFEGLLEDLGAPAGFRAGVVTFPPLEPQHLERLHQIDKAFSRGAESMMVEVCPTQAERILAMSLFLPGAVPFLPIGALFSEK